MPRRDSKGRFKSSKKGSPSKSRKGDKDYETKRGDKDYHRKGAKGRDRDVKGRFLPYSR